MFDTPEDLYGEQLSDEAIERAVDELVEQLRFDKLKLRRFVEDHLQDEIDNLAWLIVERDKCDFEEGQADQRREVDA